jgi:hypothetical protein
MWIKGARKFMGVLPACRRALLLAAAAIAMSLAALPAAAQPGPYMSDEQAGALALRNDCRPDIQRYCGETVAGGGRILNCLRDYRSVISPVCRQTLDVILRGGPVAPPPPAVEPGMPPWAAMLAARDACRVDAERLCSQVIPGGGRIIRCLMAQRDKLTPRCREAMSAARDALGY